MKPFAEDLRRQLENRFSDAQDRLGLTLDDLKDVPGGELSVALVQPASGQSALVLLVDVSGHLEQAEALLAKVTKTLIEKGAKQNRQKVGDNTVILFDLPKKPRDDRQRQAIYFLMNNVLGVSDSLPVIQRIMARLAGRKGSTLAEVPAFQTVMNRCKAQLVEPASQAAEPVPQIRWFVEPLGYIEAVRAATPEDRRRKGKTMLDVVKNQGFTAIRGVGGFVDFAVAHYELVHRTAVCAPGPYEKSMKMLVFPNHTEFAPLAWIPRDVATYTTFYWDVLNAFDNFGWLFDELFGEPEFLFSVKLDHQNDLDKGTLSEALREEFAKHGVPVSPKAVPTTKQAGSTWQIKDEEVTFVIRKGESLRVYIEDTGIWDDVLEQLKEDPNGPKIDLREELVANLGKRVTVVTDYQLPITTASERLLFAIQAVDQKGVAAGIKKMFHDDPTVKRRVFKDHVIWETIEPDKSDIPSAPVIDIPDIAPIKKPEEAEEEVEGEEKILPNAAVTVANGHLLVASHYDFLIKVLDNGEKQEKLGESTDFRVVEGMMKLLGADRNCVRSFSRTDEEYRPTYELIRMGKMPESEAMLGRLLNVVLGPKKKGVVRKQKIDGSELPDYDVVRRYLGPAGTFATSEEGGWFVVGFMLSK